MIILSPEQQNAMAPQPLASQLSTIFQLVLVDHADPLNGCRLVWDELLKNGVKPSVLSEFEDLINHYGESDNNNGMAQEILLDGYKANTSLVEVAKSLNSACPVFLHLFLFHCYTSSISTAAAVAAVAGGTQFSRPRRLLKKRGKQGLLPCSRLQSAPRQSG